MATTPPALPDPFVTYQALDAIVRTLLNGRQLAQLQTWLDQQTQADPAPALAQLLRYWRAIVFVENNQWDEGQRLLLQLLQEELHPHQHMRVLNVLAIASEHLGLLTRAFTQYTQTIHLAAQRNDWPFWAKAVKNRMSCMIRLYELGQIPSTKLTDARQELEQAIAINARLGNQWEEG